MSFLCILMCLLLAVVPASNVCVPARKAVPDLLGMLNLRIPCCCNLFDGSCAVVIAIDIAVTASIFWKSCGPGLVRCTFD